MPPNQKLVHKPLALECRFTSHEPQLTQFQTNLTFRGTTVTKTAPLWPLRCATRRRRSAKCAFLLQVFEKLKSPSSQLQHGFNRHQHASTFMFADPISFSGSTPSPASIRRPRDAVLWHQSGARSTLGLGLDMERIQEKIRVLPSKNWEVHVKIGVWDIWHNWRLILLKLRLKWHVKWWLNLS